MLRQSTCRMSNVCGFAFLDGPLLHDGTVQMLLNANI